MHELQDRSPRRAGRVGIREVEDRTAGGGPALSVEIENQHAVGARVETKLVGDLLLLARFYGLALQGEGRSVNVDGS